MLKTIALDAMGGDHGPKVVIPAGLQVLEKRGVMVAMVMRNYVVTYVNCKQALVVPPRDPNALREAMRKLNSDEQLYQRLSSGTQIHYQQYFTIEKMTEKHLKV